MHAKRSRRGDVARGVEAAQMGHGNRVHAASSGEGRGQATDCLLNASICLHPRRRTTLGHLVLTPPATGRVDNLGRLVVVAVAVDVVVGRRRSLALICRLRCELADDVEETGSALALVEVVLADEVLLGVAGDLRGGARLHKVSRYAAPVTLFGGEKREEFGGI